MATDGQQLADKATKGKPSPEELRNNPAAPDARDTNAGLDLGKADPKQKVMRQLADGSVEESTVGELADSHGDPITGDVAVPELNPGYYPAVETATEGAAG